MKDHQRFSSHNLLFRILFDMTELVLLRRSQKGYHKGKNTFFQKIILSRTI